MDTKKQFQEPLCDIVCFAVEDILSSSDWGGGDIEFWSIQDL